MVKKKKVVYVCDMCGKEFLSATPLSNYQFPQYKSMSKIEKTDMEICEDCQKIIADFILEQHGKAFREQVGC